MSLKRLLVLAILDMALAASTAFGAPVITDFSPIAGTAGDQVGLTGSGFTTGSITVRFWNGTTSGVVAPIVFINSDTLMTVAVPSGITTGPISVQQGSATPFYTANDFLAIGFGPYITWFSPLFGSIGDSIVINGVHLTNTVAVQFNGTNATDFVANSAGTQITTRVPFGASSGPLTVSTLYGTSNSPSSFTVIGSGPYITDFSPISGDSGTTVLIDGVHFTGVTNVTFNGQAGTILGANSDTLIQVAAPFGVTSGPIGVSTLLGTVVTSSNFFGKPVVTGFSPALGRAGTNVVLGGTNLLGATAVYFGGVAATSFTVVNNTNLQVAVPTGALTGLIRVVVPGASAFSAANFLVRPTVSGFSPGFGGAGTPITITGANFNVGTPIVRFNGLQAATPTGVSFGQLTALVPASATTGPISVTTTDGSDTNSSLFYIPASITSFTPTNSPPGTRVTITGQNFTGATAVSFNGAPAAAFVVTNNTSLGATVPANPISGPILVTTPAGTAASTGIFYGAPLIAGFTPSHGLPGTNVTISGINFLGGSVQLGGLKAALVSLNNTQVVATVPVGAKTGPITVSGPGGTNTSLGLFSLDYSSDLRVSITNSPNPVTVGSNLVFTVSFFNAGPYDAPNATFTNLLPSTATLVSANVSGSWSLNTNGSLLTGRLSSFGNGNSTVLTVVVVPQAAGTITNTVFIASDNLDPHPADNSATITTVVQPLPLLSINLPGSGQVRISWPASLTNYLLQFEDQLGPNPQWSSFTNPPAISGGFNFITDTNNGAARFYRLQR